MIKSKDSFLGVFGYRTYIQESSVPDLDRIDMSNPSHVKVLLPMNIQFDPNNEMSFVILDLNEVIERSLDDEEKLIVDMLRDEFQIKEIAEELEMNYKNLQYKIRKITEKIAKNN